MRKSELGKVSYVTSRVSNILPHLCLLHKPWPPLCASVSPGVAWGCNNNTSFTEDEGGHVKVFSEIRPEGEFQ